MQDPDDNLRLFCAAEVGCAACVCVLGSMLKLSAASSLRLQPQSDSSGGGGGGAAAAAAARLRSASRGSAAFGAEVGRMAEKQRPWTLHRGIPVCHVVKDVSRQPSSHLVSGGH